MTDQKLNANNLLGLGLSPLTDQQIAGLLCCGFEGGVGYWCQIVDYIEPSERYPVLDAGSDNPRVYRHNDYALLPGGAVICREVDADDESEAVLTLDRKAITRGLQVMAAKYPQHFADALSEDEDATTGDVFIQCCLLGEIVYG